MLPEYQKSDLESHFRKLRDTLASCPDVRFWWRDDDVSFINLLRPDLRIIAYQRLHDILDLLAKFNIPSFFAVVPNKFLITVNPLLNLLKRYQALVAIHGITHKNRSRTALKSEFPPDEGAEQHIKSIILYYQQFKCEFHERLLPFFVPPFNNISHELTSLLHKNGFRISSCNVPGHKPDPLNIDYDFIDWNQRKIFTYKSIICNLVDLIEQGQKTIGINSHHKIINKRDLYFFYRLFEVINPDMGAGKEFFLEIANKRLFSLQ